MADRAYKAPETIPVSVPTSPEKVLLIEVLKSAVRDVLYTAPRPRSEEFHLRRNAANWIESEDPAGIYHFTFIEVCDALGICHKRVRQRIEKAVINNEAGDLFERRSALSYRKRVLHSRTKKDATDFHKMPHQIGVLDNRIDVPALAPGDLSTLVASDQETSDQLAYESSPDAE